ncbi:aminoglycoside phosphotransferase family protein [Rhabdothermincola salaria]|uniref:aminoglycoside phosphotransferase family protein n=1 Tax=Rhabdothermincola salaria TaxID=2903142 RepID=UPI001E3F4452|nr:aminoglycoside phosphotransferase family protein [Rhabdothermincola salaria]MCD9624791.1 aminoglycoside phosphotransferase family protein [Rhabdothermincola salaria]
MVPDAPFERPSSAASDAARLRPASEGRERAAMAAVLEVADHVGLDAEAAGIWRAGSSVLVGLPVARVLGRVDDPRRVDAACRQVIASEVMAERGVPAITLTGPADQPVLTEAGPVTLWRWLDAHGVEASPEGLGRLARRLHDATRGGVEGVAPYDPLTAVAAELERAAELGLTDERDLGLLDGHIARLRATWPAPEDDPLGVAVVHGDLHRDNAIVTDEGLVLADLELAGVGPAAADLVPHVVAVRRYDASPRVLEELMQGYGRELHVWPGLEVMVEAYELWVTAWSVANRGGSAVLAAEAEVRLDHWRPGRDSSRPWSLR